MKIPTLFILLFLSISIQAQTNRNMSISGIVKAKSPVDDVHCFLKNNNHLGGVTDSSGYFHFNFQETLLYDTLVISSIGFERKEIPLSSLILNQDTNYFYLNQKTIILDEVIVEEPRRDDLKKLVLKTVANIPKNYPNKRHQLKGLYRKVSTEGSQYTHLEEAVITLEDKGYKRSKSSVKISTEAFRETKNWDNTDSLAKKINNKIGKKISEHLNIPRNPLYKLYRKNFIRSYKREKTYFNIKNLQKSIDDYYTFELMDIVVSEGDTIYKIAFAQSVTPPPPKQASGRTYLKINTKDLAIVETQFTYGYIDEPIISQIQVKFLKKSGKYYPKFIKEIGIRSSGPNIDDIKHDIHTFWFDDVKIKKFKRIRYREANDPQDPQSYKRVIFNPEFWENSPLIKKYPLEQGIRKDLEKNQPLEEQFQESGQN